MRNPVIEGEESGGSFPRVIHIGEESGESGPGADFGPDAQHVPPLGLYVINQILDLLAAGLKNNELYSAAPAARGDRAAWKLVSELMPDLNDKQCKDVIRTWKKNGVIYDEEYHSKARGEAVTGVRVNNAKRPGASPD